MISLIFGSNREKKKPKKGYSSPLRFLCLQAVSFNWLVEPTMGKCKISEVLHTPRVTAMN